MDFVNRPKIKDLKRIYKFDGFYLHTHPTLGVCVSMNRSPQTDKIAKSLRRRGYIVIPDSLSGLWETYYIQTKEKL